MQSTMGDHHIIHILQDGVFVKGERQSLDGLI